MDALICYLPVIHSGYLELFKRFIKVETALFIIGESFTRTKREFQKDLRAIPTSLALQIMKDLGLFSSVGIIETFDGSICGINPMLYRKIYLPNDSVSRELVANSIFRNLGVEFVDYFLRWDPQNATEQRSVDCEAVESNPFLQKILRLAIESGQRTSDIYRSVGAVLFDESQIHVTAFNSAVPNEFLPFFEGDPRSLFKKGINLELSTALHAEAKVISTAARNGIKTDGLDLMVTDFPCPPCAKLIAYAGIRNLYFSRGYSVLDGERILKEKGVCIHRIENTQSP